MLDKILANPVVGGILKSAPVRFAGGLAGKVFSLPATLAYEELFKHNPWGTKDSAMYGKGPGSLEYAAAIESANRSGRTTPIEGDYLSTPQITEASMIPDTTRMAGDTSIGSGGFLAPAGYELQGDYTDLSATPPGGNGDIYAGNQGGWVNAPVDYELQGDYTNLPTTPPGGNGSIYEGDPVVIDDGGRQAWLDKTANSPAARAGFSDDHRWSLHLKNRDFQQARKTGTLDEFAEKYPDSQTAKKRNWNPRMGRRS